ncbi:MAG: HDOD domain-containing protein [Acidovorax sp.]
MQLDALVAAPLALPCLPRTVALLMNALAAPEPDLRRVNQLFGTDPALAARLLELANSAAFQATGQIVGIPEALALLGAPQLRALVAQAPLGAASRSVPGVNLPAFWRYSLHTAKLARSLAGLVRHDTQAAYTAGLLHGLGALAMHMAEPEEAQAIATPPLDPRRARQELRQLGFCYSQVSAGLARRWQLPGVVADALEHLHAPFDNGVYEPLAGVLHLASWHARAREAGLGERELAVSFPGEVGLALGLDIDMVLQQDPIDWSAQAH